MNIPRFLKRKYYLLRSSLPAWRFLNRRGRRRWQEYLVKHPLNFIQKKIISELKQNGIAISSFKDIFSQELLNNLVAEAKKYQLRFQTDKKFQEEIMSNKVLTGKGAKKDFLIPYYGGAWTKPVIDFNNSFIKLSLDEMILAVAAGYLGSAPKLNSFSLQETVVSNDSEARLSQRWHRDPEDRKLLKMFLYLNDVLEESTGPFTYIVGSHRDGKWGRLFPQQPPQGVYPPAGAVEKVVPKEDIKMCLGKSGTLIFADTAGLHRGGLSTQKSRLMFVAGYVLQTGLEPRKFETGTTPPELNELANYALT